MLICNVVGARPNFMKMAPIINEFKHRGIRQMLVHTGQHYDGNMSQIFFEELGMPEPDMYLDIGSDTHARQTARIMIEFEQVCAEHHPDLVIVAGDVNSTVAAALVAAKLQIPLAHVEAGLRSFDRTMPEEINRVLTDHMCELLFTTEPSGAVNLRQEGIASEKIFFVGNSMIDSLRSHLERALTREPWKQYEVNPTEYGVVTFHRPSNVDDPHTAGELAKALREIGKKLFLIFPAHPRTLSNSNGLWTSIPGVKTVEPLGYLDFLGLIARARIVITDSGGIQEETTALGVPCLTVRNNTERPITITEGTNRLVKPTTKAILAAIQQSFNREGRIPELWDGQAAKRIVDVIEQWLQDRSLKEVTSSTG